MRFSNLFAPTTKESPKDATLPSHKLLVRAGFISQYGSGLYNFLPMGKIVYDKIENIVKEEMDRVGACEIQMGVVTPAELWKQSGRYGVFGKELLRLRDRKNNDFVLSPTHEEVVVDIIRGKITSYKQLPIHLYQITTKFRDEARPRYGLLRCREFIMKDGYSFHATKECMKKEFDKMEIAYRRIFARLGLDFRVVDADSGAIGGSGSREFMVLTQNGEDDIIVCGSCEYAANIEAATKAKKTTQVEAPKANSAKFHTPNCTTIGDVAEFFKIDEFYAIKAVIKKAIYEKTEEIVLFFVRGNETLQDTKALNACGALELVEASEDEVKKVGLVADYCGPIGLPKSLSFFIDKELEEEKNLICGANEHEYHNIGVSMFNFKKSRYADLVEVGTDERCSCCNGKLELTKGIEVGHIFQLGQKYTDAMQATFLDENGRAKPFYMGCYGVGVSRLVAVMIEVSHDEKGCIWSKETTPFDLDIIVSNIKNSSELEFGEDIYRLLKKDGYSVLLDDRKDRFGSKIKDFELIGFPYALIVGKGLKDGQVELVDRRTLKKTALHVDEVQEKIRELLT